MLALLGLLMVAVLVTVLLLEKCHPIVTFILVPTVFVLIGGLCGVIPEFSLGLFKDYMSAGVSSGATTAVTALFSVFFFGIMSDMGVFDPIINWLAKKAGNNVSAIVIVSGLVAALAQFCAQTTVTMMLTIPTMLPLYKKYKIRPAILCWNITMAIGIFGLLPWYSQPLQVGIATGLEAGDFFIHNLPMMGIGFVIWMVWAFFVGKKETARLARLGPDAGGEPAAAEAVETKELTEEEKKAAERSRKLMPINLLLIAFSIFNAITGKLGLQLTFGICAAIAFIVNYPNRKDQSRQMGKYAQIVLPVVGIMIAAAYFSKCFSESGMLNAIVQAIVSVVPESLGASFNWIFGVLAHPASYVMGSSVYLFGFMPLCTAVGEAYGISVMNMATTMILGRTCSVLVSPLAAAVFLMTGMTDVSYAEHVKYSFVRTWIMGVALVVIAILLGLG